MRKRPPDRFGRRLWIRVLTGCLALAPALRAGERDAGHAPAERWAHPRGPASGSGRSLAEPISSLGPVLWSHTTKTPLLFPPLVWDGVVFLVEGPNLVALDATRGRTLATTSLRATTIAGSPALHDHSVFLLEGGRRLAEYHLRTRTFEKRWSCDLDATAKGVRIHEGEIYVTTDGGLFRLRRGRKKPAWTAEGRFEGEPAIFGPHLFAVRREKGGEAKLVVLARRDGSEVSSFPLDGARGGGAGGSVAVSEGMAAVQMGATWTFLIKKEEAGVPTLELLRSDPLASAPLLGSSIALALSAGKAWVLYSPGKQPVRNVLPAQLRPDLVRGCADPVGQGEILSFGSWAGDLNANEIQWHVSELRLPKEFGKGVGFASIPAGDERLLLVPADAKAVHLVAPEEFGS